MRAVSLLGLARDAAGIADRCGDWRTVSSLTRSVFFVLGALIAGLTGATLGLLHLPAALLLSGLIAIALAEWLIFQRRFFGSGIEEGLEITGLLMIVAYLTSRLHDASGMLPALLCAVLLFAAGLRLLNPLVVTASALALSAAVFLGVPHPSGSALAAAQAASAFCGLLAVAALALGRATFQRPSHDRMLDWLMVVMPVASYLWFDAHAWTWSAVPSPDAAPWMRFTPPVLLAGFGICALVAGLRRRRHAPLLACLGCAACLAYELRKFSGLALEYRLIAGGTGVLLLTLTVDRYLRVARRGLTSAKISLSEVGLDLLELAGAATLAPQAAPGIKPGFEGGGGRSGGGGASGSY
jgi:hypothetical protein